MTSRAALVAALATARATVASLEAAIEQADGEQTDEQLGFGELREQFHLGREAVLGAVRRGELEASRGPRGKLLIRRRAIEGWLRSRPFVAAPRRVANVVDLAAWEREQELELQRAGGGR